MTDENIYLVAGKHMSEASSQNVALCHRRTIRDAESLLKSHYLKRVINSLSYLLSFFVLIKATFKYSQK